MQRENYYHVYTDRPVWLEDFFREDKELKLHYYPFFEWRRMGLSGKCINVSPEGIRKTLNPSFGNKKDIRKIFCFGGPLMWGATVCDEFTIPSLLSGRINRVFLCYEVINFAEVSYTLTQEIMYLITRLKQGDVPDLVIFLDGFNDIFATYDSGEVGTIVNLNSLRHKFIKEELSNAQMFFRGLGAIIEDDSSLVKIVKLIRNAYYRKKGIHYKKNDSSPSRDFLSHIPGDIASDYKKNIMLVEHLAKTYKFKCAFFYSLYCRSRNI